MAYLRLSILICMLLFSPICLRAISPKNIFILSGQSNMSGRGGVSEHPKGTFVWDGYIPPESQPDPSILRFNPDRQWEEARDPLSRDIDIGKTAGIGPGMSFAKQLMANSNSTAGVIGLVPYARGGTSITQWLKNPAKPQATHYDELLRRIKLSEAEGGVVRAFFWMQGETDKTLNSTAIHYKERLLQFITDIRNDIKPRFLPVILVKIASMNRGEEVNIEKVRTAEDEVAQELPDVHLVDARKLVKENGEGFNGDGIHLNATNEIILGKWIADCYLTNYGNLL